MQGRSRSTVVARRTWPSKNTRTLALKGTAVFLLLVFATVSLHGNWLIALFWVGGGVGIWILADAVRRRRERTSLLREVELMDDEAFLRYAADLLRAQGYVAHKAIRPVDRRVDLLLTRGRESV